MSAKSNQHYVPKFYFRFFSADGKRICVLNRNDGNVVQHAPIKSQASRSYYYGNANVENAISRLEGLFSTALRKLRDDLSGETLDEADYTAVLQGIAFQKARTMSARTKSKAMQDRLAQLPVEISLNTATHLNEEKRERMRALLGAVRIEANPQHYQALEMKTALEGAHHLQDLSRLVLLNRTNRPFIFGDAPAVFYNSYYRDVTHRGVLGLQSPGLQVFLPLGPHRLLALIDSSIYRIKRVRENVVSVTRLADVANLNKLQIHNASSAVYFPDFRHAPYVKELWRQESLRLGPHIGRVVEAPGFDHNGQPLGEILHAFEPQLPMNFSLSFLVHETLGDESYVFRRRT